MDYEQGAVLVRVACENAQQEYSEIRDQLDRLD